MRAGGCILDTPPLTTLACTVRPVPSADLCNDGVPHCRICTAPVKTGFSLHSCLRRLQCIQSQNLSDCKDIKVDVNLSIEQVSFLKGSTLPGVAAEQKCSYEYVSSIDNIFRGT